MHALKLTTLLLTAVAVNAFGSENSADRTIADAQEQCGNGQAISCCNQGAVQNNAAGIFSFLDSSQCSPININGKSITSACFAFGQMDGR